MAQDHTLSLWTDILEDAEKIKKGGMFPQQNGVYAI